MIMRLFLFSVTFLAALPWQPLPAQAYDASGVRKMSVTFARLAVIAALVFMALRPAQAADKISITDFAPYQHVLRPGAAITVKNNTIIINGTIGPDDFYRFGNLAIANPKAQTVVLTSPGGYAIAALKIGVLIHALQYATVADNTCGSSCVIIWASGTSRTMRKNASLLMHCVYHKDTKKCDPKAVETVAKYFGEWDMPTASLNSLKASADGRVPLLRIMKGLIKEQPL
jgi:hypothetical protein